MAKERLFNLPETKGSYQLRGIVSGTSSDRFYQNGKTSTGKEKRNVNFGVEVEKGKTLYVSMQAFPRDEVFFHKKAEKKGEKGDTARVKWAERHTFNKEGYRLIGMNLGLAKVVGADGNMQNDKKTMVEFDACDYIGKTLKDDMSVFVKGGIEFSSFSSDDGTLRRMTKFVPNQISLCGTVDFDDEKFEAQHDFTQTIVFMGVEQEKENDKATGRFIVSAKIVTYSTIEDAMFIITDSKLANMFKKNLKPYTAINVWGKIDATTLTEETESDDCWGESNAMTKVSAPTRRELVITGADPKTIDNTVYTEAAMEEAMVKIKNAQNAKNDFGENTSSSWGDPSSLESSDDDEEDVW